MNSPRPPPEEFQSSRLSKSTLVLMLIIVGLLALLAIFTNIQSFRRGEVETVVLRPVASSTPQAR